MKIALGPPVVPMGLGRKDYSAGVEKSVQPVVANRTPRISWSWGYLALPSVVYPNFYATMPIFFYDEYDNLVTVAPRVPYHMFEIELSSPIGGLVFVGFQRFASLADFWAWNVEKWYGDFYGYGRAKTRYTAGIKTEEGKLYSVSYGVYSELPNFDVDMDIKGIEEDPLEYR